MKRVIVGIVVLIFVFFVYITFKLIPDFYLNTGKNFYSKKDYISAHKNLKIAHLLSPKNMDIRYYYVQTLKNLKPTLEIQKEVYNIYKSNSSDSANLLAEQKILKWRKQILSQTGENYIQQTPFNDKILRWDAEKFPLNVDIERPSQIDVPYYYIKAIKKAFFKWQKVSGNLITFKMVDDLEGLDKPDIKVKFAPLTKKEDCKDSDCKYVAAYTVPKINNGMLKEMDIIFFDSNNLGKPFSEKEIYNTALHEIGHALGIMGHSYDKNNIMYMETTPNAGNFNAYYQSISSADLNTLVLLYKLIPDITNTPKNEFDTSYQLFAPIVMGTEEQIITQKMLEAQNYIKAVPNLPNGYIDLSFALAESRQYSKAIETLNKALSMSSNEKEKFVIYNNLAVIYMKIKDWQNVIKYTEKAKQFNPDANVDGLTALAYFNLGEKDKAKSIYKKTLEKNPSNVIDAYNLATIYLKELNFTQAGKTLNDLILANPQAKNDPRIKRYSVITFFFR